MSGTTIELDLVRRALERLGEPFSPERERAFCRYAELLLEWNQRVNLTGLEDWPSIERRLIVESLALLPWVDRACNGVPTCRMIDVGSGAGVPGIPLALVRPQLAVTLLDATAKKVRFLEHVVQELRLQHVRPIHERAETLAHRPDHRGRYDLATARALAHLATALELTLPFLRPGGLALFPKGTEIEQELAESRSALDQLGGELLAVDSLPLADLGGTASTIVVVRAARACPPRFPRRPGIPAKRPLQ
ncbi:16S rRNA (guanine(527)-N(7))-methyltransferase RsmG [Thermomicrobium sp. 4228-Ro]|uniref:16S rRNA (guanine(527)-N(7))-methyltransferase RsmG n=1 Tax=Thermomicrobium sp. 4228-Ro TaxID=2993937 RepID=UPI002248BCF0|nr:16S rRNA (guanine(527)-N(7))-methyltransferase RsmG [Thermomicrobium sp. 4228-Ro]MCX2727456.1 16S rRNA (guanine(527)-N(7))-methyltransferase RsmG [Thermomicrobium sp. 4228-Ro]